MKKVEAIIRSSCFEKVKEALSSIGVNFLTFYEVKGYGRQKSEEVYYRGTVYDLGYIARLQLQIVVPDDKVEAVVQCILESGHTGEVGDGKIFIYDIEKVLSIRTGSEGKDAL